MAKKFLTPIDMGLLEIQNFTLQSLASDPTGVDGRIYYNTGSDRIRFYNGSQWANLSDSASVEGIASAGATAPIQVSGTNDITISISAATTSAAGSMSGADKTKLDNATSSNTSSTLVIRDGSGNFSAGTITAALTGSATQLDGQSASYYLNRANHTGTQAASTISDLATTVKTYRLDEFAAPAASVSLNSQKITNLGTPTADGDAATKGYVDAARTGLDAKESVRAATTANITLSGTQTVDGVSLASGNRVLVKNQSTASQNGIYVVAAGAWARSTDADTNAEVTSGMFTFVEEGTTNANSGWVLSTANPITVGTTSLTFVQFSGAGSIVAGNGLSKSGDTISAVGTTDRITVSGSGIDIASTYVGQSTITTLGTVATGTWNATTIAVNKGGTGITSYTSGNYIRASGTTTLEQRTPANVLSDIGAVEANGAITGATKTKITYDAKGLVTAGADLTASDIPNLAASKITSGTFDIARLPTVTVPYGGTGLTSVTSNSYLKGAGTGNLVPRTYAEVKTDLSLNNVENTAISTWAGSANITTVGTIATGTWSGNAIAVSKGGTGATDAAGARTNLGAITKYATNVGNNSSTSIAVTHNLGSRDVTVAVYEVASPYDEVECTVTHTSTTQVTLGFAVAPTTDQYRVVVTG